MYEQQAINLENNWMAKTWVSFEPANNLSYDTDYYYVTGYNRTFNIALSNDNGNHWTPPIVMSPSLLGLDDHGWTRILRLSNSIIDVGDNKGQIRIDHYADNSWNLNIGGFYKARVLEIDFSKLTITEDPQNVLDFIDEYSGNILYDQGINYSQIREYINNETIEDYCTLFYNEDFGAVERNNLKECRMQIEPALNILRPEIRNIFFKFGSSAPAGVPVPGSDPTCFNKGTKIYTPNGYKNIEELTPGDIVYSLGKNEKMEETKVLKLLTHTKKPIYGSAEIILEDNNSIKTTLNHSFYDPITKNYKQLHYFKAGDYLYRYNKDSKEFENIKIKSINKIKDADVTYNLSLMYPNNYLANGVVAHNTMKTFSGYDFYNNTGYAWVEPTNWGGGMPIQCKTTNHYITYQIGQDQGFIFINYCG
jgi:hypothetical protein